MNDEGRSVVRAAVIGAAAAVVAALVTTLGTIYISKSSVSEIEGKVENATRTIGQILLPPGSVVAYSGPLDTTELKTAGWLPCDGQSVRRTEYPSLFRSIGTVWGKGDGVKTFQLPDLRGVFLRGVNGDRGGEFSDIDAMDRIAGAVGANAGNLVGSFQPDNFKSHSHERPNDVVDDGGRDGNFVADGHGYGYTVVKPFPSTGSAGGAETRPRNAYVHYIIKF